MKNPIDPHDPSELLTLIREALRKNKIRELNLLCYDFLKIPKYKIREYPNIKSYVFEFTELIVQNEELLKKFTLPLEIDRSWVREIWDNHHIEAEKNCTESLLKMLKRVSVEILKISDDEDDFHNRSYNTGEIHICAVGNQDCSLSFEDVSWTLCIVRGATCSFFRLLKETIWNIALIPSTLGLTGSVVDLGERWFGASVEHTDDLVELENRFRNAFLEVLEERDDFLLRHIRDILPILSEKARKRVTLTLEPEEGEESDAVRE